MSLQRTWFGILVVGLAAGSTATAQVDHRVQPGQPVPGHARDANPQLGSGGFNSGVVTGANFINSANAVMSGNVSGLGGFHYADPIGSGFSSLGLRNSFNVTGLAPYSTAALADPNVFRGSLPSANLSYFDRRAFSVGDTRMLPPGQVGGYTPYYAPANTVVNIGGLQRGINQPGTSMLASPYTPLYPGSPIYTNVGQPLPSGVPNPLDRRSSVANPLNQPVPSGSLGFGAVGVTSTWQQPYAPALGSPLFGPSGVDARPSPWNAAQAYAARAGQANLGDAERAAAERQRLADAMEAARRTPDEVSAAAGAAEPSAVSAAGVVPGVPTPQLGADRFTDMTNAIREVAAAEPDYVAVMLRARAGGLPGEPPAAPGLSAPGAETPATLAPRPVPADLTPGSSLPDPDSRLSPRMQRAARWARDALRTPIRSFAGTGDDQVNRHLLAAEAAMRSGNFYTAAGEFALASTWAPDNPLPLLGRGHALAAAGEYVSAALFLTRGIGRFPDIVAFDLDLPALVGGRDVFDRRRADLEQQLARHDTCEMRFLLGYLEYYSGLRDVGLKNLRAAAAKAAPGSVIARFPEMLSVAPAEPVGSN